MTKHQRAHQLLTPKDVRIIDAQYENLLRYLFDRPVAGGDEAWYWNIDEPSFVASSREWVALQTLAFARCGTDLVCYSDEQVGHGLNYLMNNAVSGVAHAADDASVSLELEMTMLQHMPTLWRDCFGPRLERVVAPIGAAHSGQLGFVCYMWFDVWPTFYNHRNIPEWRDAMWIVLRTILGSSVRECRISALHGMGHNKGYLQRDAEIETAIDTFARRLGSSDPELREYALAARSGMVQ